MSEEVDWTLSRRIPLKTTTWDELNRIREVFERDGEPDDGDLAGDREPRNPKIPPAAGAMALELSDTE